MATFINSGNGATTTLNEAPRVTDAGLEKSTDLLTIAQIAIATINTLAAIDIADKQYDIAKGYLNLAKELRDYWNNTFKPCEQKMVAEACSAPLYEPQYALTAGRYVASVRQQFRKKAEDITRCVSRYCTGLTGAQLKDLALAEAVALGSAVNYAYRYEEARKEAKDDQRWNRRKGALDMGRNLQSEAVKYAGLAGNMYNSMGQQAAAGASGALAALGRDQTRVEGARMQRTGGTPQSPTADFGGQGGWQPAGGYSNGVVVGGANPVPTITGVELPPALSPHSLSMGTSTGDVSVPFAENYLSPY